MTYVIDPSVIVFIIAYVLLLSLVFVWKYRQKNAKELLFYAVVILYLLFLVRITMLPITFTTNESTIRLAATAHYTNFVPLKSIFQQLQSPDKYVLIGGNVMLLIPLVIIVDMISGFKLSALKLVLIGFIATCSIEILQLLIDILTHFPNKVCDIDDIILNTIGVVIGALFCKYVIHKKARKESTAN